MNSSLKLTKSSKFALYPLVHCCFYSASNILYASNASLVHGIEQQQRTEFVPNHRKLGDKEFEAFNEFIRNARRLFVVSGAGKSIYDHSQNKTNQNKKENEFFYLF